MSDVQPDIRADDARTEGTPAVEPKGGSTAGAPSAPAPAAAANHGDAEPPASERAEGDAGSVEADQASEAVPGGEAPSASPKGTDADACGDGAEQVSLDLDELTTKAAERDEYLALAQRTQADFENYRKRVAREAAQAEARGIVRLAKELLPGLDNLDRALAAHADSENQFAEGIKLVQAELIAALGRVGLEAYSPQGERFDPALHEAIVQQPAGEGVESGTIIEVYQPGYRLVGNVIRPARVVVAA
jgi:molecular chaperone GrpE